MGSEFKIICRYQIVVCPETSRLPWRPARLGPSPSSWAAARTKVLRDAIRWHQFCGDVVFEILNKPSRDEDHILDQMFKSKYALIFFMLILFFKKHYTKMYIHTSSTKTLKTFKYAFSSTFLITFKNLNLHNKSPKILAFHTFGLKYCLIPVCY